MVVAEPAAAAAPALVAPPLPGWLWLPATPPELELTPAADPAAPLVAVPPVASPSFAEEQPSADSATTRLREESSLTDLLFMVRLSATPRAANGRRCRRRKATRTAARTAVEKWREQSASITFSLVVADFGAQKLLARCRHALGLSSSR